MPTTITTSNVNRRRFIRQRVSISPELGTNWTQIDFLYADKIVMRVAPSMSFAQLTWKYGEYRTREAAFSGVPGVPGVYSPLDLDRQYVKIEIFGYSGDDDADTPDSLDASPTVTWYGVIEVSEHDIKGVDQALASPLGNQDIQAFGLEREMERQIIRSSFVDVRGTATEIGRGITFNVHEHGQFTEIGNRSATPSGTTYIFSERPVSNFEWSALQALRYLIERHPPSDCAGVSTADWRLVGQRGALGWYDFSVDTDRRNLKDIFDDIVDRRRGVGYYVEGRETATDFIAEIKLFSFADTNLALPSGNVLPANPNQIVLDFETALDVYKAVLRNNAAHIADIVIAEGEPITSTLTFQFDSTGQKGLKQGWTATAQTAYNAGAGSTVASANKIARSQDWLADVYRRFVLNRAGFTDQYTSIADGLDYWIAPDLDILGNDALVNQNDVRAAYDAGSPSVDPKIWSAGKHFLRFLPEKRTSPADLERRDPFVLIQTDTDCACDGEPVVAGTGAGGGCVNPLVAFHYTKEDGLAANFDASGSADPDGTIAEYAWNFGDGTTALLTTPQVVHGYHAFGSYTVTLTVTDNDGCTATTSQVIDFPGYHPPPTGCSECNQGDLVVQDCFADTDGTNLENHTPDFGGPWTTGFGPAWQIQSNRAQTPVAGTGDYQILLGGKESVSVTFTMRLGSGWDTENELAVALGSKSNPGPDSFWASLTNQAATHAAGIYLTDDRWPPAPTIYASDLTAIPQVGQDHNVTITRTVGGTITLDLDGTTISAADPLPAGITDLVLTLRSNERSPGTGNEGVSIDNLVVCDLGSDVTSGPCGALPAGGATLAEDQFNSSPDGTIIDSPCHSMTTGSGWVNRDHGTFNNAAAMVIQSGEAICDETVGRGSNCVPSVVTGGRWSYSTDASQQDVRFSLDFTLSDEGSPAQPGPAAFYMSLRETQPQGGSLAGIWVQFDGHPTSGGTVWVADWSTGTTLHVEQVAGLTPGSSGSVVFAVQDDCWWVQLVNGSGTWNLSGNHANISTNTHATLRTSIDGGRPVVTRAAFSNVVIKAL